MSSNELSDTINKTGTALESRFIKALSFRTVVPVALFAMIFVLSLRQATHLDPDLWWHIKAGEQIVLNQSVPHVDNFSYTKQGAEWVAHEWLSEVLIYELFRAFGLVGLTIVFSTMVTAVLFITYLRCHGRPYAASIATLLAASASSPLFGVRPQMITLLFAGIYIAVLEKYARKGYSKSLIWLIPMMLLWVNLHAGFALGLGLVGLYIVSLFLDGLVPRLRPLALVLLSCIAIVPINPNGFRMYSYPIETITSSSMAAFIEEWASPDFHKLMYLPLALLMLATFAVLTLSTNRAKKGELFLVLVTCFAAMRSVRHIPIFALVAAPVFANHLWDMVTNRGWDKWFTKPEKRLGAFNSAVNLLLLALPFILIVFRLWHFAAHERSYEEIRNPVAAVDFLQKERLPGPIYNRYGWGGYLIYRLYPDYRVYIDGRADVYGDDFFAQTMNVYDGLEDADRLLDNYHVNTVLIAPSVAMATLLRANVKWTIVYEDKQAVIFGRVSTLPSGSQAPFYLHQ